MSKKPILIVLGSLGMILLLTIISAWRLRKLGESFSIKELPKFERVEPEQLKEILREIGGTNSDKIVYKEFTSPDGKLKMKYSSDWIEIKEEELLEKIIPKEEAEKYSLKNLFLAQKFKAGKYAQLKVNELTLAEKETIEKIIEEMKESNLQQGWDTEIIKLEIKDNEAIFEAKYQKPDRLATHSKEKIIILESQEGKKKAYLIVFIAFEKDWRELEKEADEILESAHLID